MKINLTKCPLSLNYKQMKKKDVIKIILWINVLISKANLIACNIRKKIILNRIHMKHLKCLYTLTHTHKGNKSLTYILHNLTKMQYLLQKLN